MKKQKKKYMNRKMLILSLIGYVAMLILMLIMDVVTINRDRKEQTDAVETALIRAEEKLSGNLENMTNYLYAIYEEDPQFQTLAEKRNSENRHLPKRILK